MQLGEAAGQIGGSLHAALTMNRALTLRVGRGNFVVHPSVFGEQTDANLFRLSIHEDGAGPEHVLKSHDPVFSAQFPSRPGHFQIGNGGKNFLPVEHMVPEEEFGSVEGG